MKVANILPNNCIKEGMLRQDVEMFLTHKILEDPRRFAFLSNEKGAHYKILDNSACELGEGLDLRDVLEAAKIIDADEIVLPDIPRSGKSMCKTLKYLADVPQGCKYKLAAVVQGETEQEIANCAMQILSLKRINTIMIPKWYCGWNSTNGMGRIRITSQIVDMMCKMRKAKEIHWLGLDTGFRELIHPINAVVLPRLGRIADLSARPLFPRRLSHKNRIRNL